MPTPPGTELRRMNGLERVNLILRAIMELGVICGLAWWGYRVGGVLLAVAAPVVGFGFWGAVDFHHAGRAAEALRLIQELVISGLAAGALYVAGAHVLGYALASVSVAYHALVYIAGNRLLKGRVGRK
ncbi:MAG: DUF2568 domain-containing protein [Gemmatimonadales bacterium]